MKRSNDLDMEITGLAHELWAMAQGRAAIDEMVTPMMSELRRFCEAIQAAEREACRAACRAVASPDGDEYACGYNQGALDCEDAILKRPNVPHERLV